MRRRLRPAIAPDRNEPWPTGVKTGPYDLDLGATLGPDQIFG